MAIDAVIFDFGGVLMDWNPDYLYRKLIPDPAERRQFLTEICGPEWVEKQDRGRSWDEAVAELAAIHPDKAPLIEAFRDRWIEMLAGPIAPGVALVRRLHIANVPLYGLTNWCSETFKIARPQMPYLDWLRDTVVSGEVRLAKPDPRIFRLLFERNGMVPERTAFIDDHTPNIEAAKALGLHAILYKEADSTEAALRQLGLRF